MAGMFYSLKEVAEKLNITEEKVRELVGQGRLREFRDGSSVLFKIDEVEALMSDSSITAAKEAPAGPEQAADEDEISLASPEGPEDTAAAGELTGADTTAVAGEGINVLDETTGGYQPTDDTMAETKAVSGEASLEDIEEDVSLDTFGSGSGLLDLSLQADDTSLGGILDEIYTPEGGEQAQEATDAGSAMEVAAEAEQMLPEEVLAAPQPATEPSAVAAAYIEPAPDVQSNAFGIMLFLPLLVVVYTAIVAVAAQRDMMPAILGKIQGIIWYILLGAVVAEALVAGAAFMLGGKTGAVGKKRKAKQTPQPRPKDSIEEQAEAEEETEGELEGAGGDETEEPTA